MGNEPKRVAAIVTEYSRLSHADVIVGKILDGYNTDRQSFPNLRLVSMYVDQFPEGDMSRALAKQHNFMIYDTIAGAVTLGRKEVAVDGVLCIGEHGNYPRNERGQIMYPRRRFFEGVTDVFAKYRRSVPVFNDKHLGYAWADARWMYDRARELMFPLMAGSSIPVTWRRPALRLPRNCELTEAVQIGYSPFEAYGFHALEGLQCMAERRRGGETGVRAVTCLQGDAMWQALDRGVYSRDVLEAAMAQVPAHAVGDVRKWTATHNEAAVFIIEYRDGFKGAVRDAQRLGPRRRRRPVHLRGPHPRRGPHRRVRLLFAAARSVRPFRLALARDRRDDPDRARGLSGGAHAVDDGHPGRGDDQQGGEESPRRDAVFGHSL